MIKRSLVVAALSFSILTPAAVAQSPVPTPAAPAPATSAPATTPPADTTEPVGVVEAADEDGESKPWIRLIWLAPLAVLIGAGSVFGRRLLIERGWLDAA